MKLSIVTINYNNKLGLEKTIDSVKRQTLKGFEYILIDGGSTDGSLEVIQENEALFASWVSEPDRGIYNAMNKGISKATGDYILFINSGDSLYSPDSLKRFLFEPLEKDIIFGDLQIEKAGDYRIKKYPDVIRFSYMLVDSLPHPATLMKRGLFELYGMYDETFGIAADWKFFILTICKYNVSYEHREMVVSSFDFTGVSSVEESKARIEAEKESVYQEFFPLFVEDARELRKLRKLEKKINKIPLLGAALLR
jgi:glycosyltransferase involved in cell wall biosynthesis